MPEKPEITREDFGRLLTEININTDPITWFEKKGLDEEILKSLVYSARSGLTSLLLAAMAEPDDDDPGTVMGNICATMLTAGFAMGWEAHEQFGGE